MVLHIGRSQPIHTPVTIVRIETTNDIQYRVEADPCEMLALLVALQDIAPDHMKECAKTDCEFTRAIIAFGQVEPMIHRDCNL